MIIWGDAHFGGAIAEAAGSFYNPVCDQCVARIEGGELYGGAVYQRFTGASIGMHVAGFRSDWLSRDLLWAGFHYPFMQLGVKKVFGQIQASNTTALEFDLKLGFKIVATINDVFPDGDLIVVAMARDECRWLKRITPRGIVANKEIPDG